MLPLTLAEALVEQWTGTKVSLAGQPLGDAVAMNARGVSWAPSDGDGGFRQTIAAQQVILIALP